MINLDSFYPNDEPQIGMGCTVCYITDSRPATIINIKKKNGKVTHIEIQYDKSILIEGSEYDGSAKYEYERDPNGIKECYRLRKNNKYVVQGAPLNHGPVLSVGHRRKYYDPHF